MSWQLAAAATVTASPSVGGWNDKIEQAVRQQSVALIALGQLGVPHLPSLAPVCV